MNTEIKRHIDAARQVLVGVVPNPSSQIDQITNALIYKFMDDMDQAAIKVGGDPNFFTDDLEKYAWTRLMDPRLGNQERMNLYSEALMKFSESKQLPELFRDIFKSAFLPYRNPETLGMFLKEINYFDYSHSEELGNAYEYLLSIMSSQGDAGQFRTPRHIIDFIVEVVNPTKDDKVLDPACGTAGFLISGYKHILKQHNGFDDPNKKEKPLTPDQRKSLFNNFEGYDIDPGMVRIAQVNMYLHQFKNPKIYQYDTLSMEDRWNDKFDVIMANPPFMSPKGGIKPHTKFGIKSSRSEVLFVDYIINHLRPNGRAGIIVPSSISINDNASYYKEIRKEIMLNGLCAIVELHEYIFRPYAEVSTNILFFDKTKTDLKKIPIFTVNNDGFDKSDIRSEIANSELPIITKFLKDPNLQPKTVNVNYIDVNEFWESDNFFLSSNLNNKDIIGQKNGVVLGDLITEQKEKCFENNYISWSVSNKSGFVVSEEYFNKRVASKKLNNYKVIKRGYFAYNPSRINVGSIALNNENTIGVVSPMYQVFSVKDENIITPEYLFTILKSEFFINEVKKNVKGSTRKVLRIDKLKEFHIPLPTIDVQNQIVKELNKIQQENISLIKQIDQNNEKIKKKIGEIWNE